MHESQEGEGVRFTPFAFRFLTFPSSEADHFALIGLQSVLVQAVMQYQADEVICEPYQFAVPFDMTLHRYFEPCVKSASRRLPVPD